MVDIHIQQVKDNKDGQEQENKILYDNNMI